MLHFQWQIIIIFLVMWFPPENIVITFSLGCEVTVNGSLLPLKYQFNHMEFRWRQKKKLAEHFKYLWILSLCMFYWRKNNFCFYRNRYNALLELQLHFFNARHARYNVALKEPGQTLIMNYLVFEGPDKGQFPPLKNASICIRIVIVLLLFWF